MDKKVKPFFYQRLIAYLFDFMIVTFVASLISIPFVNTKEEEALQKEYVEVMQKYINQEVSTNEYTAEVVNIQYQIAQNGGFVTIVTILLSTMYFVVFQLYNKGQTLGKKLMKIKVISTNGELGMNQMIFRSFLANNILFDIISVIFVLFSSKTVYFYCVGLFSIVQYLLIIISFFMVIFQKEGMTLHDYFVHTKVVKES